MTAPKHKRARPDRLVSALAAALAIALGLLAQSGRDNYRNLYRAWREADPAQAAVNRGLRLQIAP